MVKSDVNACFEEISYFVDADFEGYPLLIDVENFSIYRDILERFEADSNVKCIYLSDFMGEDSFPNISEALLKISEPDYRSGCCHVLVGLSQALMFQGRDVLHRSIGDLVCSPVYGHAIILLVHCKSEFEFYMQNPRNDRQMILVEGLHSDLPQLDFIADLNSVREGTTKIINGFRNLMKSLEHIGDEYSNTDMPIFVRTKLAQDIFPNSIYAITRERKPYEKIISRCWEFKSVLEKEGTQEFWTKLSDSIDRSGSFLDYLNSITTSKNDYIVEYVNSRIAKDSYRMWIFWLGIKLYYTESKYISYSISFLSGYENLEKSIYIALSGLKRDDPDFDNIYKERRKIIASLPEINIPYISEYCDLIGIYEKEEVYYLTSLTPQERHALFICLDFYYNEYDRDELVKILETRFSELFYYIKDFTFNELNTKLPVSNADFRDVLSSYFRDYKFQKITNHIEDEFIVKVNQYALTRPFFILQERSSILNKIDKERSSFYFIDALGVEYLSYIEEKCRQYGLDCEISICHCQLPSITCMNKEFLETCPDAKSFKDLDKIKHHDEVYDYTQSKLPTYIFEELDRISSQIKQINLNLIQNDKIDQAVIISDHGASRLAVIYGKESDSNIKLEEKGRHGGRCCQIDTDPKLPQVSYQNGYAVLANYERFKGGKMNSVEVHGGASFEESVIPVIIISRKKKEITYKLSESKLIYKIGQPLTLVLFSNEPMKQPYIVVNDKVIKGVLHKDKRTAEFEISKDINKAGKYVAQIFEGNKNTNKTCDFVVERATHTNDSNWF